MSALGAGVGVPHMCLVLLILEEVYVKDSALQFSRGTGHIYIIYYEELAHPIMKAEM